MTVTNLIKEPRQLGGCASAGCDAGLVVAVEVNLLSSELLSNVTPPVVERQATSVGLVYLGAHHQQRDVDLANLAAASVPGPGLRCGHLAQPLVEVEAALPVGEVVYEDDTVDIVHEDVSGVPLTVAASDVPELHEELLLAGRPLQVVVQLHLHRAAHSPAGRGEDVGVGNEGGERRLSEGPFNSILQLDGLVHLVGRWGP